MSNENLENRPLYWHYETAVGGNAISDDVGSVMCPFNLSEQCRQQCAAFSLSYDPIKVTETNLLVDGYYFKVFCLLMQDVIGYLPKSAVIDD